MTDPVENAQHMVHFQTCDACAQSGVCIDIDGASVCESCQAFHERAIGAAARALWGIVHTSEPTEWDIWLEIYGNDSKYHQHARTAVKAYCEYEDE